MIGKYFNSFLYIYSFLIKQQYLLKRYTSCLCFNCYFSIIKEKSQTFVSIMLLPFFKNLKPFTVLFHITAYEQFFSLMHINEAEYILKTTIFKFNFFKF